MDNVTPNVEVMPMPHGNNLATVDRAEIDMQIATAKQYPRSVSTCLDNARALIKMDKDSAAQAFYLLDFYDKSKPIIGPSIRMAEILAGCWKNIRYGSRPLEVTESTVVAQGYCYDLENNVAFTATKTKSILDKRGQRFKPDLVVKIMLATQAIAERDAILKVIPRAFANNLVEEAMNVADGGEKSMTERQDDAVKFYSSKGITVERLCAFLEVDDARDMTIKHLQILRALANSIKDGVTTIEEAFRADAKSAPETATIDPNDMTASAQQPTDAGHGGDDAVKPATKQTRADIIMAITKHVESSGMHADEFDGHVDAVGIDGAWDAKAVTTDTLKALLDRMTAKA
jgi:hypothetical protein